MKSKKHLIVTSIIIVVVSLLVFTILNFHIYPNWLRLWLQKVIPISDLRDYFIIISSGTFTGALVTLLIGISEYRVERQVALEDFCDASIRFIADLYNLEYLRFDIPIELLQKYYAEITEIPFIENKTGYTPEYESQNKIKEYLWHREPESVKEFYCTPSSKMVYLKEKFDKVISEYDKQIDVVMKQYILLAEKMNRQELNKTFSRIDFLFGNSKYRKDFIHKRIYAKQTELLGKIKNIGYHFRMYYESTNGNKPVMIEFIVDMQNYLFSTRRHNQYLHVYMQYLFDMNCELHQLIKLIYGKGTPDQEPKREEYRKISYFTSNLDA